MFRWMVLLWARRCYCWRQFLLVHSSTHLGNWCLPAPPFGVLNGGVIVTCLLAYIPYPKWYLKNWIKSKRHRLWVHCRFKTHIWILACIVLKSQEFSLVWFYTCFILGGKLQFWFKTIYSAQWLKNPPANLGDVGSIPGSGRSPGGRNGNPLQYSCLEDPMDRGAWQATVHGVAKSWTCLSSCTKTIEVRGVHTTVELEDQRWPETTRL